MNLIKQYVWVTKVVGGGPRSIILHKECGVPNQANHLILLCGQQKPGIHPPTSFLPLKYRINYFGLSMDICGIRIGLNGGENWQEHWKPAE